MQPAVIPSAEAIIDMVVILVQPVTQIRLFKSGTGLGNGGEAKRLGKEMGRHQDDTPQPMVLGAAGIDGRNAGPVTMA